MSKNKLPPAQSPKPAVPAPKPAAPTPPRRNVLVKLGAIVFGAVITLVPSIAGAVFLANPLLKKKRPIDEGSSADEFLKVGTAGGLQAGGAPMFFPVIGTKVDAWTTYPKASLGAVYVRKLQDGQFECFNARCTHLGCTVKYQPEQSEYLCPCHASAFDQNGKRLNDIPPRNLDTLDVQVRNGEEIWVHFQNFRAGREAKIPV